MEKIGLRLPARTGGGHTEIAFWETESGETAIFEYDAENQVFRSRQFVEASDGLYVVDFAPDGTQIGEARVSWLYLHETRLAATRSFSVRLSTS